MSPEEISKKIGIRPTNSWKMGDKKKIGSGNYKFHSWQLDTGYQKSLDLNTQIKQIYDKILPIKKDLKVLMDQNKIDAMFQSVIEMYGDKTKISQGLQSCHPLRFIAVVGGTAYCLRTEYIMPLTLSDN